ncbi:MAG: S41 family peptidase [Chloroflexota bacterium]
MAMQFYFAHWQDVEPDFDLESEIETLMQTAIDTEDRFEFGLAMKRFIAQLNNSHTWYNDNWMMTNDRQKRAFRTRAIEHDQWMVTHSFVDDLQAGDVITHVEGRTCADWFAEVRPYINASSERIARRAFINHLLYFIPQVTRYTLDDGRDVTIDHATSAFTPNKDKMPTGAWIDEGKIAQIHIPSFNEDRYEEQALAYVEDFKSAETIIFDMRDCEGGNTPMTLIYALMDRPFKMWSEATPMVASLFHYRYQERVWGLPHTKSEEMRGYYDTMEGFFQRPQFMWTAQTNQPKTPTFTGNILMLTGINIGSAGEDFVIPFKSSGRATLIGENTLGSTGQPYHYRMDNGIWLAIGTKRAYMPDGSRYEGIGIAPDIHLQPTKADLKAGHDVVMERALEIARKA